jgi:hypothetical protein
MLINLSCVDGPLITVIENTTGMITLRMPVHSFMKTQQTRTIHTHQLLALKAVSGVLRRSFTSGKGTIRQKCSADRRTPNNPATLLHQLHCNDCVNSLLCMRIRIPHFLYTYHTKRMPNYSLCPIIKCYAATKMWVGAYL